MKSIKLLTVKLDSYDLVDAHVRNEQLRNKIAESNEYYSEDNFSGYLETRIEMLNQNLMRRPSKTLPEISFRIAGNEFTSQIGHVALLMDYAKLSLLGKIQSTPIIVASKFSNPWLYSKYVSRYFTIIPLDEYTNELFEESFLDRYLQTPILSFDKYNLDYVPAHFELEKVWSTKNLDPVLTITEEDREFGFSYIKSKFLHDGYSPFVTVHCRNEPSYHPLRNADIESYRPAIEWLISQGWWVFRIGNSDAQVFDFDNEHFVDLTRSDFSNDRLDVFLLAENQFMIGSASGPSEIPNLFGRPLLWTNTMKLLNQDYKSHAFSLPKLFESFDGKTFKNHASEGAYLLESPTCLRGSWRSNSGDEILKATKELFRLKSDRGGILNKGPLFDKLNEQTGGRLTLIPDFFLDTHYEYFFD